MAGKKESKQGIEVIQKLPDGDGAQLRYSVEPSKLICEVVSMEYLQGWETLPPYDTFRDLMLAGF